MLMEGFCGYHADAEDGEEQKPGQVCAAPVLQRSPFSLCPLKDTHARTHTHGESTAGPAGTPSLPLSHLPRPANSARLGSVPSPSSVSVYGRRERSGAAHRPRLPAYSYSRLELIGLNELLALILARPALLPGTGFPFTVTK